MHQHCNTLLFIIFIACLPLPAVRQAIAYLLLFLLGAVLVPRELLHHCEVHEHHCESEGLHLDDISLHLSCEVCDFQLTVSEAIAVKSGSIAQATFALLGNQPLLATKGLDVSILFLRGPPASV